MNRRDFLKTGTLLPLAALDLHGQDPETRVTINRIAANGGYSDNVTPYGIASLFGDFGEHSDACLEITAPLGTEKCGIEVLVGGVKAPIYNLNNNQINIQFPQKTGDQLEVIVRHNGFNGVPSYIDVANEQLLTLFQYTVEGLNQAVAVNEQGILLNALGPGAILEPGRTALLFGTGSAPDNGELQLGVPTPTDQLYKYLNSKLFINGQESTIASLDFNGLAPGFIGLTQANIKFDERTPAGIYAVQIEMSGGQKSNTVHIPVAPKGAPFLVTKSHTTLGEKAKEIPADIVAEDDSVSQIMVPEGHQLHTYTGSLLNTQPFIVFNGKGDFFNSVESFTASGAEFIERENIPVIEHPGRVTFNPYAPRTQNDSWKDLIRSGGQKLNNLMIAYMSNIRAGEDNYVHLQMPKPSYKVHFKIPEDQQEIFRPFIQSWNTLGEVFVEDSTEFWTRGESGVTVELTTGRSRAESHIYELALVEGRPVLTQGVGRIFLNENLKYGDLRGQSFAHELGHYFTGHWFKVTDDRGNDYEWTMGGERLAISPFINEEKHLPYFDVACIQTLINLTNWTDLKNYDWRMPSTKESTAQLFKEQRRLAQNAAALTEEYTGPLPNIVSYRDPGRDFSDNVIAVTKHAGSKDGHCGGYEQIISMPRSQLSTVLRAKTAMPYRNPTIRFKDQKIERAAPAQYRLM